MMDELLAKVFAEAEQYDLLDMKPDEVTPYMMANADPAGKSDKIWRAILDKMVKAGKAEKLFRRSENNRRIIAYRLVNK